MAKVASRQLSNSQVLLWSPQIVAYIRLFLLSIGLFLPVTAPFSSCLALLTSLVLDGLDGILARHFNQVTHFGAFLDVAIDNLTRAVLWAAAVNGPWSAFPTMLESLTFACTHTVTMGNWKENYFQNAPPWVAAVMHNGFRTPPGCLAIGGLMGLPLWLYCRRLLPDSFFASLLLGVPLTIGRILCACVECWAIKSHLNALLSQDVASRTRKT